LNRRTLAMILLGVAIGLWIWYLPIITRWLKAIFFD
jgi:hypothetical protein